MARRNIRLLPLPGEPFRFLAESENLRGIHYMVDVEEDRCDCEDDRCRGKPDRDLGGSHRCKHLESARWRVFELYFQEALALLGSQP